MVLQEKRILRVASGWVVVAVLIGVMEMRNFDRGTIEVAYKMQMSWMGDHGSVAQLSGMEMGLL